MDAHVLGFLVAASSHGSSIYFSSKRCVPANCKYPSTRVRINRRFNARWAMSLNSTENESNNATEQENVELKNSSPGRSSAYMFLSKSISENILFPYQNRIMSLLTWKKQKRLQSRAISGSVIVPRMSSGDREDVGDSVGGGSDGGNKGEPPSRPISPRDPDDLPETVGANPRELTIQQQFVFKQYSDQVKAMSAKECQELSVEIIKQIMQKDNLIQQMLRRKIDIDVPVPDPYDFMPDDVKKQWDEMEKGSQ